MWENLGMQRGKTYVICLFLLLFYFCLNIQYNKNIKKKKKTENVFFRTTYFHRCVVIEKKNYIMCM